MCPAIHRHITRKRTHSIDLSRGRAVFNRPHCKCRFVYLQEVKMIKVGEYESLKAFIEASEIPYTNAACQHLSRWLKKGNSPTEWVSYYKHYLEHPVENRPEKPTRVILIEAGFSEEEANNDALKNSYLYWAKRNPNKDIAAFVKHRRNFEKGRQKQPVDRKTITEEVRNLTEKYPWITKNQSSYYRTWRKTHPTVTEGNPWDMYVQDIMKKRMECVERAIAKKRREEGLDSIENCRKWLKEHPGKTGEDYMQFIRETKWFSVGGVQYKTLTMALKAVGLYTKKNYNACQKKIHRESPDNYQIGFEIWVEQYRNGVRSCSFYEARLYKALENKGVHFQYEKNIDSILSERNVEHKKFMTMLKKKLSSYKESMNKYRITLDYIESYSYDVYIPPCAQFPKGAFVETDGLQHFQPTKFGKKQSTEESDKNFLALVLRDKVKNMVAEMFDIPLLRLSNFQIKTYAGTFVDVFEYFISAFMKDNRNVIPIKEYYAPLKSSILATGLENEMFVNKLYA